MAAAVLLVCRRAARARSSMNPSAPVRRGWAARLSPSPMMPPRPGGTRQGIAGGAYANAVIEYGQMQEPRTERDPAGQPTAAWRMRPRGIAIAIPSLGVSYYRLSLSEIQPLSPTASSEVGRQDQGTASVRERALVLNQFGATVGQSVGNHLVIASTLKLVRGSVISAIVSPAEASLDHAAALGSGSETHADLDLGALATFGLVRVGIAMKNVRAPKFGAGEDRMTLKRQARAGLALVGHSSGAINQIALAFDADLTKTTTVVGDERHVAGGIEAFTLQRHVGLRAGLSANTIGAARVSPSVGASLGVRNGVYFEGQLTGGGDEARHGWGLELKSDVLGHLCQFLSISTIISSFHGRSNRRASPQGETDHP